MPAIKYQKLSTFETLWPDVSSIHSLASIAFTRTRTHTIEMLTKRNQNHRDRKTERREPKVFIQHFDSIGFEGNSNNKEIKYVIK